MKRNIVYLKNPKHRIRAIQHLISIAQESIIIQMYLFAGNGELQTLQFVDGLYPYVREISEWLIEKKKKFPDIKIIVLLDTQTIADRNKTHLKTKLTRERLEEEGIIVLNASLARTLHKKGWKLFPITRFHQNWIRKGKNFEKQEWAKKQNIWQTIHNVEDHRKNLVIDSGKAGLIMSHNFMDICMDWEENSFLLRKELSNQLFQISIQSIEQAMELPIQFTEQEKDLNLWVKNIYHNLLAHDTSKTQILKSGPEIWEKIQQKIQDLSKDGIHTILLASAYFSDTNAMQLLENLDKKIKVCILIDSCYALPLKAFLKYFLINTVNLNCIFRCRENSIALRIYPSHTRKMMHCKFILFLGEKCSLIAGQANFTPNSFSGAWLETSVYSEEKAIMNRLKKHFFSLWKQSKPLVKYKDMNLLDLLIIKTRDNLFLGITYFLNKIGLKY